MRSTVFAPEKLGDTTKGTGGRWTAVAFLMKPAWDPDGRETLCTTEILGSLSNQPAGTGCGMLRGMSEPATVRPIDIKLESWISYGIAVGPGGAPQGPVTGAVAKGVARLVFVLETGETVTVPLTTASAVGEGIHFFTLDYPPGEVASIDLHGSNGTLVHEQPFEPS